jgi:hypothetical protein
MSASQRTYESVNGAIPEGPPIDASGLAQQVRGARTIDEFEDDVMVTSNIIPTTDNVAFLEEAVAASSARRDQQGYAADGTLGGKFNVKNPPPGKVFGAFLKGNTGIVWKDK